MRPHFADKLGGEQRQTGVAVISAMLLAALVVSIAATMIFAQQRYINRLENHLSATQARWMGEASIHWSRAILAVDARAGSTDHLQENWAIRLPATPFEGGTIRGFISDQQQYCNLNNLVQTDGSGLESADFFKRLLTTLNTNPDVAAALIDWIDTDSDTTSPLGAESAHYLALTNPYRAGNQPLTEMGNLSRIQGFTEDNIARLKQYCSVLPEPTPVNINTVSPELLGIMLPELSQLELQTIAATRNLHPFESLAEIGKLLEHDQIVLNASKFSVSSHYFLVSSQTQFGKTTTHVEALLKRDGLGWPQLLWKRYL